MVTTAVGAIPEVVGDAAVRAGLADRVGAVVTFSEGAVLVVRLFTGSTS